MLYAAPPFSYWMGGQEYNDAVSAVTVVFGTGAVDDGNLPGLVVPDNVSGPDNDSDSVEPVPNTVIFVAQQDKPNSTTDYPIRQCYISKQWGAPHAMVQIDGQWYLQRYAADPVMNKKYPPRGQRGSNG